jgi:hypothetical protein
MRWFTRKRADVEQRDAFSQSYHIPTWAEVSGGYTFAGVNVTADVAVGLPAVGSAVRLLSETIAQLPLNVYRGRGAAKLLADQTWQYRLLVELPGMGDFTPFDLVSDIVGCLEVNGNAYLQKVKAAGEVIALIVINPAKVRVARESGEKVFYVRGADGREERYTASTILHIRGFTITGSDTGLSPSRFTGRNSGRSSRRTSSRRPTSARARTRTWPSSTRAADGRAGREVPGELESPQGRAGERPPAAGVAGERRRGQARDVARRLAVRRGRAAEPVAGREHLPDPAVVPGRRRAVQARLRAGQPPLLHPLDRAPAAADRAALFADADLFPQRIIYPQFDVAALTRTDAKTLADVEHQQIQSGVRQRDEIRADHGWGPLPAQPEDPTANPGQVVPMFPVGAGEKAAADTTPPGNTAGNTTDTPADVPVAAP